MVKGEVLFYWCLLFVLGGDVFWDGGALPAEVSGLVVEDVLCSFADFAVAFGVVFDCFGDEGCCFDDGEVFETEFLFSFSFSFWFFVGLLRFGYFF